MKLYSKFLILILCILTSNPILFAQPREYTEKAAAALKKLSPERMEDNFTALISQQSGLLEDLQKCAGLQLPSKFAKLKNMATNFRKAATDLETERKNVENLVITDSNKLIKAYRAPFKSQFELRNEAAQKYIARMNRMADNIDVQLAACKMTT